MPQLSLNIKSRLPYEPANFVLHAGVAAVFRDCLGLLAQPFFRLCYVRGENKSGKTHFSVKLADEILTRGMNVGIIEGERLPEWCNDSVSAMSNHRDILIVDDADHYFEQLRPGASGEFVGCVERLRAVGAGIVFLGKPGLDQYSFDEHVGSRLLAGGELTIGHPAESDIAQLVAVMARQRGLVLSERQIRYVQKRVGRSLPALHDFFDRLVGLSLERGKTGGLDVLSRAIAANTEKL